VRAEGLQQLYMRHIHPNFQSDTVEFQKTIDNTAPTVLGKKICGATIR
jgi:hypothetical protein